jgi:hypothetical protein
MSHDDLGGGGTIRYPSEQYFCLINQTNEWICTSAHGKVQLIDLLTVLTDQLIMVRVVDRANDTSRKNSEAVSAYHTVFLILDRSEWL